MSLVFPIHRPSRVLDALYANCISPSEKHLVLAKHGYLEIHCVNKKTHQLFRAHAISVPGRITALGTIRPLDSKVDWIVFTINEGSVLVVAFDHKSRQFVRKGHFNVRQPRDQRRLDPPRPAIATNPAGDTTVVQVSMTTLILLKLTYSKQTRDRDTTVATVFGQTLIGKLGNILSLSWLSNTQLMTLSELPSYVPQVGFYFIAGNKLTEAQPPVTPSLDGALLVPSHTEGKGLILSKSSIAFYRGHDITVLDLDLPEEIITATAISYTEYALFSNSGRPYLLTISDLNRAPRVRALNFKQAREHTEALYLYDNTFFLFGQARAAEVVHLDVKGTLEVTSHISNIGPVLDLIPSMASNYRPQLLVASGGIYSSSLVSLKYGIPVISQEPLPQTNRIQEFWRVDEGHIVATSIMKTRVFAIENERLIEIPNYANFDLRQRTLAASHQVQVTPTELRLASGEIIPLDSNLAVVSHTTALTAYANVVTEVDLHSGKMKTTKHEDIVTALALNKQQKFVACGYSLVRNNSKFELAGSVFSIHVMSGHLVVGTSDGHLLIYPLNTDFAEPPQVFFRVTSTPLKVCVLSDQKALLVSEDPLDSRLLTMRENRPKITALASLPECATAVELSEKLILLGGENIQICELGAAETVAQSVVGLDRVVQQVVSTPSGLLVSAFKLLDDKVNPLDAPSESTIELLDNHTFSLLKRFTLPDNKLALKMIPLSLMNASGGKQMQACVISACDPVDDHVSLYLLNLSTFEVVAELPRVSPSSATYLGKRPEYEYENGANLYLIKKGNLHAVNLDLYGDEVEMSLGPPIIYLSSLVTHTDVLEDKVVIADPIRGLFWGDLDEYRHLYSIRNVADGRGSTSLALVNDGENISCLYGTEYGKLSETALHESEDGTVEIVSSINLADTVNVMQRPDDEYIERWNDVLQARGIPKKLRFLCFMGTVSGGLYGYCRITDKEFMDKLLKLQDMLLTRVKSLTGRIDSSYRASSAKNVLDWDLFNELFWCPAEMQSQMCRSVGLQLQQVQQLDVALDLLLQ